MRKIALLFFFLMFSVPAASFAENDPSSERIFENPQDHFDYSDFARLPVLHDGRLKPMDSFARLFARSFSESESPQGKPAIRWLAETLFDPAGSEEVPVFKIRNAETVGLHENSSRLYSHADLSAALDEKSSVIAHLLGRAEGEWSPSQKDLMDAYQYSVLYDQLLHSLTLLLPLSLTPPKALDGLWDEEFRKRQNYTLMDFYKYNREIREKIDALLISKGQNYDTYTPEEIELAHFAAQIGMLQQGGAYNDLLRVIPPQWSTPDTASNEWSSPWGLVQSGQGGPESAKLLAAWKSMAVAYINGDAPAWKAASKIALDETLSQSADKNLSFRFELEILYNWLHPFMAAMALYFGSLFFLVLLSVTGQKIWMYGATLSFTPALVVHTIGIVLRTLILERPPVGTLYESILFVALICALGALLIGRRDWKTALLTASSCGTILLFVAEAFATDDTMKMLVAVLNTNFWLITHVLCITIGYGWCLLAAFLAHLYLFGEAFPEKDRGNRFRNLENPVRIVAMVALLFTTLGTILGGIWADQSWGRFWGWDPKENGALAIVIWLVWLSHAKISRYIGLGGWMAGIASLTIVVALAWFGVNLLGVGLHSYGFESGILWGLVLFCLTEIAAISFLQVRTRQGKKIPASI